MRGFEGVPGLGEDGRLVYQGWLSPKAQAGGLAQSLLWRWPPAVEIEKMPVWTGRSSLGMMVR